jgi:vitamin B12/bleomycin/antimicrobial peptide transport system ATP-binding/permease protein
MFIKTRPGFWKDLWALLRPYWFAQDRDTLRFFGFSFTASEKLIGRTLLVTIIVLTLGLVYINVQFNSWYNDFYNTLQDKKQAEFFYQMGKFGVLASIYIVVAVYAFYLNQMLQIRWRRWLTERYLQEWLSERTYYRMQLTGKQTDNPDQRISEDMKMLVDDSLSLSLGFLNAAVTLVSFVGILWGLSGALAIPLGAKSFEIPGYMVWVALVYAIVGTWLTHKLGKPLIGLNFNQQRFEADFRFNLVRFRENTEGIALYRGEPGELESFRERFSHVVGNWWALMRRNKILNFFTIGYNQIAVIFPFLVGAPRYFAGAIPLGGLIQISNAFGQVQGALSWFIGAYSTFASWKATVDRLTGFHIAVMTTQEQQRENPGVAVEASEGSALELDQIDLGLPTGRKLLSKADLEIPEGARVLVRGPSGSGKSTLFRAIAGIWPFGGGRVRLPKNFHALFLPQRPYFPLGTLQAAVSYPAAHDAFSEEQVNEALVAVGLLGLTSRMQEEANWSMQLSGGEQQRVAFARALLHKPNWLFMDEATSALDEPAQATLLRLLHQRLSDTTVVSIAHRPAVAEHHDRTLEIQPGDDGHARLIWEPAQAAA